MIASSPVLRQAGVIAYRIVNGTVQVLLVTSRETKRWIIPKGNVAIASTAAHAAEEEAFEEAGIKAASTVRFLSGVTPTASGFRPAKYDLR